MNEKMYEDIKKRVLLNVSDALVFSRRIEKVPIGKIPENVKELQASLLRIEDLLGGKEDV